MSNYKKLCHNGMDLLENLKKALYLFLIMLIPFPLKQTGKEDLNTTTLATYTTAGESES